MGTEGARELLVERVCARLCAYCKPWKAEEERCGGVEAIDQLLTAGVLSEAEFSPIQSGQLGATKTAPRADEIVP